jgi:hypothetical protein
MPLWSKLLFSPGCSSLSALTYSNVADVVSRSVSDCWKEEKLFYVSLVEV